jgi:UDP-N-acetylmuramate dehydrogenase
LKRLADAPLAERTTLGLGGPARELVVAESLDELRAIARARERLLVLGGGSNLVVGDAGFDGAVVQLGWSDVAVDGDEVTAAAGADWDAFVAEMVDAGRAGIECLAGIPGRVGATPMQNVGAYGQEVADTITRVRALDRFTGELATFSRAQCGFAYRTSWFKGSSRWIVVDVTFELPRREPAQPRYAELAKAIGGAGASLAEIRAAVIALRRSKGMVVDPADPDSRSAGSFFTNPIVDAHIAAEVATRAAELAVPAAELAEVTARAAEVAARAAELTASAAAAPAAMPQWPQPDGRVKLSAAWLIERAGFAKGTVRGRVGISTKHALALINRGGATTAELLAFANEIRAAVLARFGVALEPEPVIL